MIPYGALRTLTDYLWQNCCRRGKAEFGAETRFFDPAETAARALT
jgi:hypothetical protein